MATETTDEFVKKNRGRIERDRRLLNAKPQSKSGLRVVLHDTLNHFSDACDRLEITDKKVRDWGKDQIFHYCNNSKICPYPQILCSVCTEGKNFNAFDRLEQQQKCITQVIAILKSPLGFVPEDAPDNDEVIAAMQNKVVRAIAKAEEMIK